MAKEKVSYSPEHNTLKTHLMNFLKIQDEVDKDRLSNVDWDSVVSKVLQIPKVPENKDLKKGDRVRRVHECNSTFGYGDLATVIGINLGNDTADLILDKDKKEFRTLLSNIEKVKKK